MKRICRIFSLIYIEKNTSESNKKKKERKGKESKGKEIKNYFNKFPNQHDKYKAKNGLQSSLIFSNFST